ncbi:MAG: nucleotidyltransferase substrate binding protein [Candidatus Margulisiibacteriota bacterium]|jgi:nucleotidyltransferase substrate binding protein (TIGR01987 family)
MTNIRWQQRLENFEKAYFLLLSALKNGVAPLNDLEQEGVIQRFEYTLELAWKTIKDYLDAQGIIFEEISPKAVIKKAFAAKLLINPEVWLNMLEQRNLLSHTYNEQTFINTITKINDQYLTEFSKMVSFFNNQKNG